MKWSKQAKVGLTLKISEGEGGTERERERAYNLSAGEFFERYNVGKEKCS